MRHSHARTAERIMGRRIGTGGTSGVDYLVIQISSFQRPMVSQNHIGETST